MTSRRWLVALATLIAMDAATIPAAADGSGVVSMNGRVGSLAVGKATQTAVRRFAGRPTKIERGTGEGGVALTSYRYRCGSGCNTYFYFDGRGRLANFITRSRRYRTANGTRIGQPQDAAEAQELKAARSGPCAADFGITRQGRASLHVGIANGRVSVLTVAGKNSVLGC